MFLIIPLREKIGNYDRSLRQSRRHPIIPLREKIGNYDMTPDQVLELGIIPLREKIGNYDYPDNAPAGTADYTTTRENWELRRP